MIFPGPEEVNEVWHVVAKATANNQLGISSKVAPDSGDDRKGRLVCIYTEDFRDMDDVRRVLLKLKDLGLVLKSKAIFYKCGKYSNIYSTWRRIQCMPDAKHSADAWTYLNITSTNEYNIKASMYSSKDLLEAKDGRVESYFYPKKKDENGD